MIRTKNQSSHLFSELTLACFQSLIVLPAAPADLVHDLGEAGDLNPELGLDPVPHECVIHPGPDAAVTLDLLSLDAVGGALPHVEVGLAADLHELKLFVRLFITVEIQSCLTWRALVIILRQPKHWTKFRDKICQIFLRRIFVLKGNGFIL